MLATANHRTIDKFFAVIACVALLSLPAMRASAQAAPPPDYKVIWLTCDDATDRATGEETVSGTFMYTVPTTGEEFQVALLMTNTGTRTTMTADYYDASGNVVATAEIIGDDGNFSLTEHGRRVSEDASYAFVEVLKTDAFQSYLLDDCLALKCKDWVKKLIKGMCLLAAGACCVFTACAQPCVDLAQSCGEKADNICNERLLSLVSPGPVLAMRRAPGQARSHTPLWPTPTPCRVLLQPPHLQYTRFQALTRWHGPCSWGRQTHDAGTGDAGIHTLKTPETD